MKIGLYSRVIKEHDRTFVAGIIHYLQQKGVDLVCYDQTKEALQPSLHHPQALKTFHDAASFRAYALNYLLSFGGDGTLLDTMRFVQYNCVPVMGINTGTLGFISSIPRRQAYEAMEALLAEEVLIDHRSLLQLRSNKPIFDELELALNDFTIQKRDTGSMIIIKTYLNGQHLTTYRSDGLVISTPTGSTAYSLSCGGPIIFPDSGTFSITPVSPHNLSVRPVVVSDESVLSFEVAGRGSNFLVSLDSRYAVIDYSYQLAVCKAPLVLKTVRLKTQDFVNTLQEKLMWGVDNRNYG